MFVGDEAAILFFAWLTRTREGRVSVCFRTWACQDRIHLKIPKVTNDQGPAGNGPSATGNQTPVPAGSPLSSPD